MPQSHHDQDPSETPKYTKEFQCPVGLLIASPIYMIIVGGRICLPYPCMLYETTKRVSQWQGIYRVGVCQPPLQSLQRDWPNTLPTFSQPLVHNPHLFVQLKYEHINHMQIELLRYIYTAFNYT